MARFLTTLKSLDLAGRQRGARQQLRPRPGARRQRRDVPHQQARPRDGSGARSPSCPQPRRPARRWRCSRRRSARCSRSSSSLNPSSFQKDQEPAGAAREGGPRGAGPDRDPPARATRRVPRGGRLREGLPLTHVLRDATRRAHPRRGHRLHGRRAPKLQGWRPGAALHPREHVFAGAALVDRGQARRLLHGGQGARRARCRPRQPRRLLGRVRGSRRHAPAAFPGSPARQQNVLVRWDENDPRTDPYNCRQRSSSRWGSPRVRTAVRTRATSKRWPTSSRK